VAPGSPLGPAQTAKPDMLCKDEPMNYANGNSVGGYAPFLPPSSIGGGRIAAPHKYPNRKKKQEETEGNTPRGRKKRARLRGKGRKAATSKEKRGDEKRVSQCKGWGKVERWNSCDMNAKGASRKGKMV